MRQKTQGVTEASKNLGVWYEDSDVENCLIKIGKMALLYTRRLLYLAPHPANVNVGMYNIFVYTDIVDHQTVGDSYVPLLRIVHISRPNNHMITNTYDRPHYLRLCKTHIDSIHTRRCNICKGQMCVKIPF